MVQQRDKFILHGRKINLISNCSCGRVFYDTPKDLTIQVFHLQAGHILTPKEGKL